MRLNGVRVSEGLDSVLNAQLTGKTITLRVYRQPPQKVVFKGRGPGKNASASEDDGLKSFPSNQIGI